MQVECVISDYLSKDKLVEIPVTLFHPPGSRFANQTTTIKRGSLIFFSGALTQIEANLYLELHNFSFVRNQTFTSPKQMPWTLKSPTQASGSNLASHNIARSIHNKKSSISVNMTQSTYKKSSALDNPISDKCDNSDIMQPPDNPSIPQEPDNPTISLSDDPAPTTPKTPETTRKNPPIPVSTSKRKTRSTYKPKNKAQKLADIASNIIAVADSDHEEFNE